jgi:hypothetical protein
MDYNKKLMKCTGLILLIFITVNSVQAQTWAEWTQQKKTKVKCLLEQIAALEVYAQSARKGYAMVKNGLTLIGDLKNSEFHLHQDYFNALKSVNPNVKGYGKVAAITAMQMNMVKQYRQTLQQLKECNYLHIAELDYYRQVANNILEQGADNLEMLLQLISKNQFALTDEERLKRIDDLYKEMQDGATFLARFTNEVKTLSIQRLQAKKEVQRTQWMYGLK